MNEILILLLFSVYNVILAYKHVLQRTEADLRVQGKPIEAKIKSKLWHRVDAILNAIVIIGFISFASIPISLQYGYTLLAGLSLRWLIFDGAWNYFRGVSFWYRGSTGDIDSFNIPIWLFFGIKFILVILSIILILI